MNKLLFFAYYFPPTQSVACSRSFHIAQFLAQKFPDHTVYSTENQSLFPVDDSSNLSPLKLQLLPTCDYRTIFAHKNRATLHYAEVSKRNLFVRFLLALNDTLPFCLFFGEGGLLYIVNGYRRGAVALKHANGHVFTSYRTASDVVVGFLLKRKYPSASWMVDFQDLPVNVNRLKVLPDCLHWSLWRFLIRRADQVSTVSNGLQAKLEKIHPKVKVIRDGIVPRPYQPADAEKFILSYTGSLYFGIQTGDLLFRALSNLIAKDTDFASALQLSYAGKDSALWQQWMQQYQLSDFFVDHGMVSRTDAMQMQDKASINLLLTWSFPESKGIVTGKIYEYLAASKPILLLINGETDAEMEEWFAELACGKVCYQDHTQLAEIEAFVRNIYTSWKEAKLSQPFISPEKIQAMSWQHQLTDLLVGI